MEKAVLKKNIYRLAIATATLLAISAVVLFLWGPGLLAGSLNSVYRPLPLPVSQEDAAIHKSLFVADLHCDALMWPGSLQDRSGRGHVDINRLLAGNVGLQVFSAVTCVPADWKAKGNRRGLDVLVPLNMIQGWPVSTWFSTRERALHMAGLLDRAARRSDGQLRVIRYREDLERYMQERSSNPGLTAGLLSIEGLHCVEGVLEDIRVMYNAGFRMMGPVHFFDNRLGGSSQGVECGGITDFGREALAFMELLQITVDLAHASPQLTDDILDAATRPPVLSHTGMRGVHDTIRNLSDGQAKRIAEKGGLIGIGFWGGATGGKDVDSIVRHIRYAADLVGVEHVALGSDFDGCTRTPFDASGMAFLTAGLRKSGFSDQDIRRIMGGNVADFMKQWLPSENDTAYPDQAGPAS